LQEDGDKALNSKVFLISTDSSKSKEEVFFPVAPWQVTAGFARDEKE
jgi:hypothetical protein